MSKYTRGKNIQGEITAIFSINYFYQSVLIANSILSLKKPLGSEIEHIWKALVEWLQNKM